MIFREGILVQQAGGIGGERDALLGPWTAAEGRTVLGLGLAREGGVAFHVDGLGLRLLGSELVWRSDERPGLSEDIDDCTGSLAARSEPIAFNPGKHRTRCRHELTDTKHNTYPLPSRLLIQFTSGCHRSFSLTSTLLPHPPARLLLSPRPPTRVDDDSRLFIDNATQVNTARPKETYNPIPCHAAATDLQIIPYGYPRAHNAEHSTIFPERSDAHRTNEHNYHRMFRPFAPARILTCFLVWVRPHSFPDRSISMGSLRCAKLAQMPVEHTRPRRSIVVDGRYARFASGSSIHERRRWY